MMDNEEASAPDCVLCGKIIDWYAVKSGRWIWFQGISDPDTAVCEECLDSAAEDQIEPEGEQLNQVGSFFWEVRSFEPAPWGFQAAVVVGGTAREALLMALNRCRGPEDAAHVLAHEVGIWPLGRAFQRAFSEANSDGGVVCVEYSRERS